MAELWGRFGTAGLLNQAGLGWQGILAVDCPQTFFIRSSKSGSPPSDFVIQRPVSRPDEYLPPGYAEGLGPDISKPIHRGAQRMDKMNSHYDRASAFSNRNAPHSTGFQCKTLRITRRIIGVLVFALTVLIAFEKPAYAYTDPGSALLIWQIAASALIGAAYYFRKFITRLIGKGDKAKGEDGVGGDR